MIFKAKLMEFTKPLPKEASFLMGFGMIMI
jgi:hypothetical protein